MGKWLNWTPPVKEKDSPIVNEERSEESPLYLECHHIRKQIQKGLSYFGQF